VSFDTLAPVYRPLEWVLAGRLLQQCRTTFLPQLQGCRRALLLGEGPGRFLGELVTACPDLEVTVLERSPGMIREAERVLGPEQRDRVRFEAVEIRNWRPASAPYDLVASHFFLDCFQPQDVARIVDRVARATSSQAHWLVSDFRVPRRGWRRTRARLIHGVMYAFFRTATDVSACEVTPPDAYLHQAGFRVQGRRYYNLGLLYSAWWRRTGS
jgi:ubiquinone/menaquinone biosynthesis C-methylase UbiE